MTAPSDDHTMPCCRLCGRPLPLAERLLAALGDGVPRTARDLAMVLVGPDATGTAVKGALRRLRETGAVAIGGRTWSVNHKNHFTLWRLAPASDSVRVPGPEPAQSKKRKPNLEKGITRKEFEAHLRQGREIAERKAAQRARRG